MDRAECPGRRHGTVAAYQKHGCRCADAREATRLYQKRLRHGYPETRLVDATGTRRRIQALWALGHTSTTIAEATGSRLTHWSVAELTRTRTWVTPRTHHTILTAYQQLALQPGTSVKTRARAHKAGYAPPFAWDDDSIDNPAAQPWKPPNKRRQRLHDTVIDNILVEQVHTGKAKFGRLNRLEQAELYRRHTYLSVHELCRRWRVSGDTITRLRNQTERAA